MQSSLPIDPVNRNALVYFERDRQGPLGIVRLRELVFHARGKVVNMGLGALGLLLVLVGIEHVHQHCLSINGLVKRLRGAGAIGIFGCVLFVVVRLFLRALGLALRNVRALRALNNGGERAQ